jgi:heat shock protein HtpX
MINEMVRQNRIRVYIYMTLLILILGGLGTFLSNVFHLGVSGTVIFLIIGIVINLVAYFFSDTLILRTSKAKWIKREQVPELFQIVEEMTNECHIPMPKLYLIDDSSMNAFATGRNPEHSAIAVTRGLLEKLTLEEVRGVVAHEISHIRNWDILLMTSVAIIAGLISILADVYWRGRIMSSAQEKDRSGILAVIGLILAVFAPLAAMFIQLAISRHREFSADASGAQIAKDPTFLASALQKISRDRRPLPGLNGATAHLYFSNPMKSEGFIDRLFSTHPPIEERIERLQKLSSN